MDDSGSRLCNVNGISMALSLYNIINMRSTPVTGEIWFSQKKYEPKAELDVPQLVVTCIVAIIILTGLGIIIYGCCTTPSQRCKIRCPRKADSA